MEEGDKGQKKPKPKQQKTQPNPPKPLPKEEKPHKTIKIVIKKSIHHWAEVVA